LGDDILRAIESKPYPERPENGIDFFVFLVNNKDNFKQFGAMKFAINRPCPMRE
jgi:hypothetical protein